MLTVSPIFKNFPFIYNEVFNLNFFELRQEYIKKLNEKDSEIKKNIDLFVCFYQLFFQRMSMLIITLTTFLSSFYANRIFNFLHNGEIECILFPSVQDDLSAINIAIV